MLTERVKTYLPKIVAYFKNEPIERAWLFGSCSRGEENPHSDIDILVDYDKSQPISLLKVCGIMVGLEDLLGRKVDLVENGRLIPAAALTANSDKILIYERTN